MGVLWKDLRFGVRLLLKAPQYTCIAILTLALGIGANTAVFSAAYAFLRKPISLPRIDRLAMILNLAPRQAALDWHEVSPADYLDWKQQCRSFDQIATYAWVDLNLTGSGDPQRVEGVLVSTNFFDTLEISPKYGRSFSADAEVPGRDKEVVLSYGLWQRQFGFDSNIVGQSVKLDGKSYTVIGIADRDFNFPAGAELWIPLALESKTKNNRSSHYLRPFGRLKEGISIAESQAEIRTIQTRVQSIYPDLEQGWNVKVVPIRRFVARERVDEYAMLLLCAVTFVLLIACTNVANLQLIRTTSRLREIAVRLAMGASRWRTIRQLLTESILLAVVASGVGLGFAFLGIELLRFYMPASIVRYISAWKHVHLEIEGFIFTLAIAVLAGLISGAAPAFQSWHQRIYERLKDGGRSGTSGRGPRILRGAFVVAEVALSVILLVGAGLMAKGAWSLRRGSEVLEPENVLTMVITLPESKYKAAVQRTAFYRMVLQAMQNVHKVNSVAIATNMPFASNAVGEVFSIEHEPSKPGEYRLANLEIVSPNYFRMMNIPLHRGREVSEQDTASATPAVVISEKLARTYFSSQTPLGRRLKLGPEDSPFEWMTIVGVVGDITYDPWQKQEAGAMYIPYEQAPRSTSHIVLRSDSDTRQLVSAIRKSIASVDPEQPIYGIETLAQAISDRLIELSYVAALLTVLGLIALVLAVTGIYGIMAYSVAERTNEIGIRMALGAQRGDILRLVLTQGGILMFVGLAIGTIASFALARAIASLLFGVSTTDLGIFGGTIVIMIGSAMLACYVPARRAMYLDPMSSLRHE
jgi:putative ABC transport system permease protein